MEEKVEMYRVDQIAYMRFQETNAEKMMKLRITVRKLKSELREMSMRWKSEMRRREGCEERCRLRACVEGRKQVNRGLAREYEPISECDDENESARKRLRMMSGGE